jgi:hypothetical protein
LSKVKKWIEARATKPEAEYDEVKREFEMAIGKPFINIKVELPEGFEDLRSNFLNLEKNEDFLLEVKELIKKRLLYERRGIIGTTRSSTESKEPQDTNHESKDPTGSRQER